MGCFEILQITDRTDWIRLPGKIRRKIFPSFIQSKLRSLEIPDRANSCLLRYASDICSSVVYNTPWLPKQKFGKLYLMDYPASENRISTAVSIPVNHVVEFTSLVVFHRR